MAPGKAGVISKEDELSGHLAENKLIFFPTCRGSHRSWSVERPDSTGCNKDFSHCSSFANCNTISNTCAETSTTMSKPCQSNENIESSESCRPWRKRGRKRMYRMAFLLASYSIGILLINVFRIGGHSNDQGIHGPLQARADQSLSDQGLLGRVRRDVTLLGNGSNLHAEQNCTPRSVENFPPNFLSYKETKNGGVFLHILIALYMFAALAVVCDDYFVPSLEHICEDLGLQADVAGATFMAAGSSAPEFMTSVVGVFFAKSDVGVGTIVGSAVFNILFIIGVCGLFAGMVVELTWYPLVRDTSFYLLSVLTLFLVIMDQNVYWFEAMVMVLMYIVYILIMYFNRYLETSAIAWVAKMKGNLGRQPLVTRPPEEHIIPEDMRRARAHSRISQSSMTLSRSMSREYEKHAHSDQVLPEEQETNLATSNTPTPSSASNKNGELLTVSEYESVWTIPEGFLMRCVWVAICPIRFFLYFTIPDSRKPGIMARLYLLSFVISVAWISGLTYIMVWMVTIAGDALDIPDTVMGLTLLAAGTSVPDCLASVFVARDGYGDMAVSNSLGSNVFDILICLGVPWLIEVAINVGDPVEITSGGLTFSALTLQGTVLFLIASMWINKWKLTKYYGVVCLAAYVMVVTLSCLFELNVFGDINPPSCPR